MDGNVILVELSVSEAQKLLEKTKNEKANKEKEMQAMGGSRYYDLIESADQIVSMHEASEKLDRALRDMPDLWQQLEKTVTKTIHPVSIERKLTISLPSNEKPIEETSIELIVSASERIWSAMERGNPLSAFEIYQSVKEISLSDESIADMGFIKLDLAAIEEFPSRIATSAMNCLKISRKSTPFYTNALSVLEKLQGLCGNDLINAFFEGQTVALESLRKNPPSSRSLFTCLRAFLSTIQNANDLFFESNREAVQIALVGWIIDALHKVRQDLESVLGDIDAVDAVASFQQKMLEAIDETSLPKVSWQDVSIKLGRPTSDTLWKVGFEDLFTQKTKILFGDAFDSVGATFKSKMYNEIHATEHFVNTLNKIQDEATDSSLIQVLATECTRVLFDVAVYLGNKIHNQDDHLLRSALVSLELSSAISCIFKKKGSNPSQLTMDEVRVAFSTNAIDGMVTENAIPNLWKALHIHPPTADWLGSHSTWRFSEVYFVYLIQSQDDGGVSRVFENLAEEFCSQWAQHLVSQYSTPLYEALASRYFGLSNENWRRVYHACWTQTNAASDDDEDDSSSAPDANLVWLPWCVSPNVSHALFNIAVATSHSAAKYSCQNLIKQHIRSQLMKWIVEYIRRTLDRLQESRVDGEMNFGESCALQCIFDLYFVRMIVGESDFLRFGWGDRSHVMEPLLAWIDPIDWELYGPALVHLVTRQYHMTRLLYSVYLTEGTSIPNTNFVPDTGLTMLEVATPVPRFQLLPVPQAVKHVASMPSRLPPPVNVKDETTTKRPTSIHHILSSTTILAGTATAASVTATAASAAAKGMSLLSSAMEKMSASGTIEEKTKSIPQLESIDVVDDVKNGTTKSHRNSGLTLPPILKRIQPSIRNIRRRRSDQTTMRSIMNHDDACKLTSHDRPMQTRRHLTQVNPAKSKNSLATRRTSTSWLNKIHISVKSDIRWIWDLYTMFLLFYTAIAVPFEIAFLVQDSIDALFIFDRCVDSSFFIDMILNFFTPYYDTTTNVLIDDVYLITKKYIKGWFFLDFISILPFDILGLFLDERFRNLMIFRILRILRIIKLVRVFRASRIFTRWQAQINIPVAMFKLVSHLATILMLAHWLGCIWGGMVHFEFYTEQETGEPLSWMTVYGINEKETHTQYITSLYWAVVTILTIGYGDIPVVTLGEKGVAIVCMIVGCGTYSFIIGSICGVISSMDEAMSEFRHNMDHLNMLMQKESIPHDMVVTLREYFLHTQDLMNHKYFSQVLETLSPGLRGEIGVYTTGEWIHRVPFFQGGPKSEHIRFVTAITQHLSAMLFPPNESMIRKGDLTDRMFILSKGIVARLGKVIGKGNFVGEDVILSQGVRHYEVRTLTFVDSLVLTRSNLNDVLRGHFPNKKWTIRRACILLGIARKMEFFLDELKYLRGLNGYNWTGEEECTWFRARMFNDNDLDVVKFLKI